MLLFKSNEKRWSYALVDDDKSRVIDMREKEVISSDASTGTYYFRDSAELLNNIQEIIDRDLRANNEY